MRPGCHNGPSELMLHVQAASKCVRRPCLATVEAQAMASVITVQFSALPHIRRKSGSDTYAWSIGQQKCHQDEQRAWAQLADAYVHDALGISLPDYDSM